MGDKSLHNDVFQAEAREASESRQAHRELPTFHLGRPPEGWERSLGDADERVRRQGRAVMEYAARMNTMGIQEESLGGNVNPIADHVATIGRDKMRLLPVASAAFEPKPPTFEGITKNPEPIIEEEEDASISSDELSGFTHDEPTILPQVDDKVMITGSSLELGNEESKSYGDDINIISDVEIRRAVEDLDSKRWTTDQLEIYCQTLLKECYVSEDRRRRLMSAGMLRKLVEVEATALRWMQRNLEAVVNDGLPSMTKGVLGPRVFKLDIILGILAPMMSQSMTQLNVMARVLRLMLFRMDTSARLILFWYNLIKEMKKHRGARNIVATHRRVTLLMQVSALRAHWRKVNTNEKHGSLPSSLIHTYLFIIMALIDAETCPKFFRLNRIKMVGGGGLLALTPHLKPGARSQRLACRILRELAREPLLIYELLRAGVAEYFSRLLPKLRESSIDNLLEALETLDFMAFSAMRFCAFSSEAISNENGTSSLLHSLVADGTSTGGLESEIRLPADGKVEEMIKSQLGLPPLMATVTSLLEETDVQLYLAGVVILGKLASTVCYHSVLQEVIAYGGRALARLVEGIQSQEDIVPYMSMALILRLCSSQEGCQCIVASEGSEMLRPLISGRRAQNSPVFLRGLVCAIALAHRGIQGLQSNPTKAYLASPSKGPSGLPLPKSGGIGRSAPPKPPHLDLEGMLYKDLVDMLDKPHPGPLETVREMLRGGSLEGVMYFLVRNDEGDFVENDNVQGLNLDARTGEGMPHKSGWYHELPRRAVATHYFHLSQRHACLGAIVLHGLTVLAGPHPVIFTEATLQYLSYSIHVAYVDLTNGRLAPDVEYPLVFRSIQLACRALAFLVTSDEPAGRRNMDESTNNRGTDKSSQETIDHGPLRRVTDSLFLTTAIKEVACMAQMPSRAAWLGESDCMYRHLQRTAISAAILIASICPIPASERDPFTRFNMPQEDKLSLQICQPLMERLVNTFGGSLCSTLMVADDLEVIAHACRSLAKLSNINTTVQILLDSHELMKAIIRLGPKAPTILPTNIKNEDEASRDKLDFPPHGVGTLDRVIEWRRSSAAESEEARMGLLNIARDGEHIGKERNRAQSGPRIRLGLCGYEIREGRIEDSSMSKLCSLPSDYFRLIANIARVPTGRGLIQSNGTLKRCLERLSLEVLGSSAAQLATLRCRSEICVLVARMAGTSVANEFILCPRYRALRVILGMLSNSHNHLVTSACDRIVLDIARHNAAYALAELCTDVLKVVPLVVQAGGLALACELAKDVFSPMPLLKHVIQAAASFPGGVYLSSMVEAELFGAMHRIANNAYPNYRPSPIIEKRLSSSRNDIETRQGQSVQDTSEARPGRNEVLSLTAVEISKSSSPEAKLISKLAQDVAYLLGSAGVNGASFPRSRCEATMSTVDRTVPHQFQEDTKDGVDAVRLPKPSQEAVIRAGAEQSSQGKIIPNSANKSRVTTRISSSERSGTYVDCGVTSCGGLGFIGDHGSTVRVPRSASIDREIQGSDDHPFFKTSPIDGVASGATTNSAFKARAGRQGDQLEAGYALSDSASRGVMGTPLALLGEKEARLQKEAIGRKGQGKAVGRICQNPQCKDGSGGYRGLQSQSGKAVITTAGCKAHAETKGGSLVEPIRQATGGQEASCFHIDAVESPIMGSTRPKAVHPRTVNNRDPPKAVDVRAVPEKNHNAGKEFVKFARPAAHWSITCALGRGPGREKGLRLPGNSNGGVVGRFACRGYLLDPIFVDQNPVFLRPSLPHTSGDRLDQVPDKSTLTKLGSSINRVAMGRTGVGVEPYRNVVEVLHHEVGVSGNRRAAERRFFGEFGRPLLPVKFHHVYDSVENRKREHSEPHLIPFP